MAVGRASTLARSAPLWLGSNSETVSFQHHPPATSSPTTPAITSHHRRRTPTIPPPIRAYDPPSERLRPSGRGRYSLANRRGGGGPAATGTSPRFRIVTFSVTPWTVFGAHQDVEDESMVNPAGEEEFDFDCSDAEHETIEPSEPQWRQFEHNVASLTQQLDAGAEVTHNYSCEGRVSGRPRQVDVFVTGTIADNEMNIAIECKRWTRRLGIGGVDEFAGKLIDLGVERGVLYSLSGFTAWADDRAKGAVQPRIELRDLAPTAPEPPPWQPGLPEFTGFGDCPNTNCYNGDIRWDAW